MFYKTGENTIYSALIPCWSSIPPPSQTVMITGTHKDKIKDADVIMRKDREIQDNLENLLTCS